MLTRDQPIVHRIAAAITAALREAMLWLCIPHFVVVRCFLRAKMEILILIKTERTNERRKDVVEIPEMLTLDGRCNLK